jgi:hypothetical protein
MHQHIVTKLSRFSTHAPHNSPILLMEQFHHAALRSQSTQASRARVPLDLRLNLLQDMFLSLNYIDYSIYTQHMNTTLSTHEMPYKIYVLHRSSRVELTHSHYYKIATNIIPSQRRCREHKFHEFSLI